MPVNRNKERITMYIEPEQKAALDKLAAKTGAVVSEHIRRAVADYLKKMAK